MQNITVRRNTGLAMTRLAPALAGVPETMLWTLYARASEAKRATGILRDPEAVRLLESLDYDFERKFGEPSVLYAVRAALMDGALRHWLRRHPDGLVVSLGEGLETQAWRVDNGRMHWLSVDLPEAIAVRARLLPPTERFAHLPASVLDPAWMDAFEASAGLFIVAQGLFMYLEPAQVEALYKSLARRFAGAELMFDIVPRRLSESTLRGHAHTEYYKLPPMPWGLDHREVAPTLRRWHPGLRRLRFLPYRYPSRRPALVENLLARIDPGRKPPASLVQLTL